MPEPFKNLFNPKMIRQMADHFARVDKSFKKTKFIKRATDGLEALELKERSNQILDALDVSLPSDFRAACSIMLEALSPECDLDMANSDIDEGGIRSWGVMPMADYVARHGLEDFDFAMDVLRELTKRSSSEFAIRPFLAADAKKALKHVKKWTKDPSEHVRRLASEGIRPRLPWGIRLHAFVKDPTPILPILEALKNDSSEYVRRSVANSLNDIAKDHPDTVADVAGRWLRGASVDRTRLVKHACRTLIKQGHRPTLKALGYQTPKLRLEGIQIKTPLVRLGEYLEFAIELSSLAKSKQPLILDYIVHHRKANGDTSPKVFKWKTFELPAKKDLVFEKRHPMKKITTRVYYAGTHELEIQINGETFGRAPFEFEL